MNRRKALGLTGLILTIPLTKNLNKVYAKDINKIEDDNFDILKKAINQYKKINPIFLGGVYGLLSLIGLVKGMEFLENKYLFKKD